MPSRVFGVHRGCQGFVRFNVGLNGARRDADLTYVDYSADAGLAERGFEGMPRSSAPVFDRRLPFR